MIWKWFTTYLGQRIEHGNKDAEEVEIEEKDEKKRSQCNQKKSTKR